MDFLLIIVELHALNKYSKFFTEHISIILWQNYLQFVSQKILEKGFVLLKRNSRQLAARIVELLEH